MIWTYLATTYDLFINRLVVLSSQFMSDFVIPNLKYLLKSLDLKSKHFKSINLKSKSESKFPNATFDYFPTSSPEKTPCILIAYYNCQRNQKFHYAFALLLDFLIVSFMEYNPPYDWVYSSQTEIC